LSTVGEMLREVRERRGLTLADAERETKIRQKFLAALEDDNIAALPGPLYVRGFLRNYALYLGIDPDEALQMYGAQSTPTHAKIRAARGEPPPKPKGKDPEKISIAPLSPEKIDTRVRYGTQYIAISLLAIPLIIVFYFIYSGAFGKKGENGIVPTTVAIVATVTPLPASAFTPVPPTAVITPTVAITTTQLPAGTGTPTVGGGANPTAVAEDKVTVKVAAQQDVWMRVTVDGEKAYEGTIAKGATRTWTGADTVRIRTGLASVVKLIVNGEDKCLMGDKEHNIVEKEWETSGKENVIQW